MAISVSTSYDGFLATTTLGDISEPINVHAENFVIKIFSQLHVAELGGEIIQLQEDILAYENDDCTLEGYYNYTNGKLIALLSKKKDDGTITPEETEILNTLKAPVEEMLAERETLIAEMNTPRTIIGDRYGEPSARYCNSNDDNLLMNGFQFWVVDDHTIKTRVLPIYGNESIIIELAINETEKTRFAVCTMPHLITGMIDKANHGDEDPVLFNLVNRTGYPFNDETDTDKLFVNTASSTSANMVPLYQCKTSAFITQDLVDDGYNFDWTKLKSDLYNTSTRKSIDIPWTVNEETDITALEPTLVNITLLPNYEGTFSGNNVISGVNMYVITQNIYSESEKPVFAKNKLRCSVGV